MRFTKNATSDDNADLPFRSDLHFRSLPWNDGISLIKQAILAQNLTLKFLLSVGDFDAGTAEWTKLAATNATRMEFTERAIKFLRRLGFDGLYLNWEWPAYRGSPSRDRFRYYRLIELLQRMSRLEADKFNRKKLIITAGFNCDSKKVNNAYNVKRIHPHLDFLSLVAMNFHGPWTGETGHHTALLRHFGSFQGSYLSTLNVDWCVQYYLGKGVPPSKINLGLASFGRTFTVNESGHEIVPILGPGTPKYYTQTEGIIAFFEACRLYLDPKAKFVSTLGERTGLHKPYVRSMLVGNQWIGMDDLRSISDKVCYANYHKLGGITFYNLEFDDFTGWFCHRGVYPLLRSAFEAVVTNPLYICPLEFLPDDLHAIKDANDLSSTIQVNTCFTTIIVLCAILYNAQSIGLN